jgi:hypothetical protein
MTHKGKELRMTLRTIAAADLNALATPLPFPPLNDVCTSGFGNADISAFTMGSPRPARAAEELASIFVPLLVL